MSPADHQSPYCPVCSGRLERDGVCLVCLLQEGLEVAAEGGPEAAASVRTLSLPCEFAGYRLVREIASGGMGIVYEAEDLKLKRVVALKVVRHAHFATREEAARFKAETQAIAQLDHPDIVPIYESGEEDGMPYFTMRLAEGGSLAERLKKRGIMPDREAATFMVKIARAVQHAHERGVLHRDLKPANILLDVAGRPMLSDFGLAKLLDAEFQLTRSNAHVGTPHYMSPEQAAGKMKEVTTASDVWALGVMLFQMLTDQLPFTGGSAVEVMRRITQEEPELSSSGKLTVRRGPKSGEARPQSVSASSLQRVQPDLATLILRCLEKQPARRLPSAGFLADELERFLAGQPIQSRAVGTGERLWKLALRHKAAALAIVGTSFSLVAGTGVALWQMVIAQQAEKVALKNEAEAEEVSAMILDTVNGLDELSQGRHIDMEEMRKQLLVRIHEFQGDPVRKASLLNGISLVYSNKESIAACQEALAEARKQLGPDDPAVWLIRAALVSKTSLLNLGSAEAIAEFREVLAWKRRYFGDKHAETVFIMIDLAQALIASGQAGAQEAVALLAEAGAAADVSTFLDPGVVVKTHFLYADAVFYSGRREEGLKLSRECCQFARQRLGPDHLRTAFTYDKLARLCREAELWDEAVSAAATALECYWNSVGPDNDFASGCLRKQSETLLSRGRLDERLALLRDAVRVCDQALGPLHAMTLFRVEACIIALNDMGRKAEGEAMGEAWLERVRGRDGSLPPEAEDLLREHALTLRLLKKHARAEKALRELVAMMDKEKGDTLRRFADVSNLAETLINQHRAAEAAPLLREVVQVFEKRGKKGDGLTGWALPKAKKRLAEAEQALVAQKTAGG
ncbi:protein kinase domain-containing protein [Prosthecobacter sp.]|uniref:serine/threonine-protein kinase n=1 Tax=Prosthecobacter sp. TaxID=1965333 RepID=UPI0037846A0C